MVAIPITSAISARVKLCIIIFAKTHFPTSRILRKGRPKNVGPKTCSRALIRLKLTQVISTN